MTTVRGMGIVDDLIANPGLYLGIDQVTGTDARGAARLALSVLPGRAGVAYDYEIYSTANPADVRGHAEHTIIARTDDGGAVMVIGHTHAESLTVLRETEPGTFEVGPEGAPYPMKVVVSVPAAGRIHHAWWYGRTGGEAVERDVAELTLVP